MAFSRGDAFMLGWFSEIVQRLLAGDPNLWAMVIGGLAGAGLALAASTAKELRGKLKTDPAEIIAECKKRRRIAIAALVGIALASLLLVYLGCVVCDPVATGIASFLCWFVIMLICFVKGRCPACGALLRTHSTSQFCGKCGAQLR